MSSELQVSEVCTPPREASNMTPLAVWLWLIVFWLVAIYVVARVARG